MKNCRENGLDRGKVSIIVPVYNAEQYLERCVASLLSQTYQNIEIILLNDGSTDGSGRLCDRFAEESDKIQTIHMQNGGVSAARNCGIDKSTGRFLSFVDADDSIAPHMTADLVQMLEATGSDVAGCGYTVLEESIPPPSAESASSTEAMHSTEATHSTEAMHSVELLRGNEWIEKGLLASDTRCWSKLYLREIIGSSRFDTAFTIGEDMLFLLELIKKGAVLARKKQPGYFYYQNSHGAMNRQFLASYMDQIWCWKKAAESMREHDTPCHNKVISIIMISAMLTAGKLALLPDMERIRCKRYAEVCREEIRVGLSEKGAYWMLPAGYRVKTVIYCISPVLYMKLYRLLYKNKKSGSCKHQICAGVQIRRDWKQGR